jgi:putative transposase
MADITGINTKEGKLYMCIVLELFDYRVLGLSIQPRQDRHIVVRAVQTAV